MWPFKKKRTRQPWKRPSMKRPPFGEFSVDDVIVTVWLNESFSNLNRTRTRWGFSFGRKTGDRFVKSFRMQDLSNLERAVRHLRHRLEQSSSTPVEMEAFLENPGTPTRLSA